jgi:hypothetical protein
MQMKWNINLQKIVEFRSIRCNHNLSKNINIEKNKKKEKDFVKDKIL